VENCLRSDFFVFFSTWAICTDLERITSGRRTTGRNVRSNRTPKYRRFLPHHQYFKTPAVRQLTQDNINISFSGPLSTCVYIYFRNTFEFRDSAMNLIFLELLQCSVRSSNITCSPNSILDIFHNKLTSSKSCDRLGPTECL
jgi:hypothetical protein